MNRVFRSRLPSNEVPTNEQSRKWQSLASASANEAPANCQAVVFRVRLQVALGTE